MKRFQILTVILVCCWSACCFGQGKKATEKPWMDLEHCAFCKNMSSQPGLMEHMKCDTIKTENGMLTVAIVPENMREALNKANAAMEVTAKEMQSGKKLQTCGFCDAIGMAMAKGAVVQHLAGEFSNVSVFTSTDPEVVKLIHDMADRTIKETKAMNAHQHDTHAAQHADPTSKPAPVKKKSDK